MNQNTEVLIFELIKVIPIHYQEKVPDISQYI